jgi:protein involved in polysaccharide export with SLBB domain
LIKYRFSFNIHLQSTISKIIGRDKKMKKHLLSLCSAGMGMLTVCCLLVLALGGCSSPEVKRLDSPAIMEMNSQIKEPPKYLLSPGDLICLRFLYSPELNDDEVIIGPDGNISLQLVGEVHAAGLTLAELNETLTERYYKALGYSREAYTLGVGDAISIKLLYNHELNSDVKIRPDGKISLPLIGEIVTAGMTPAALEAFLTDKYAQKLNPEETTEVTVIVQDFKIPQLNVSLLASASQVVYIGGEVNHPKMINITSPMKMLNAITMAGGINNNAKTNSIVLLRYNNTDIADAYLVNLSKVAKGKAPDITLQAYDIVFVPKTSMAKADLFMQHIWHMLPTNIIVSFPYNINPDTEVEIK